MNVQEIINIWLIINDDGESNYFHDFIKMYCKNNEIKYTLPIENNKELLDVRMIPKSNLHNRIRKWNNYDGLFYREQVLSPHNPYQDSMGYLYQSADNTQDYLKKWLLFIVHQRILTDKEMFGEWYGVFKELYYQLIREYHITFGNAKFVLPLMESSYYMSKIKETSIWLILYRFRAEMNYVKANNYFVLFKNEW